MATIARPKKYRNHAQLVQGVSQVRDRTLTPAERLFLLTLAAFTLGEDPHPGNEKLATACAVTTKQGVRKIARKLVEKRLVEIVEFGTGRGHATAYRICVEDDRFPSPKGTTPELPVSDDKRATGDPEKGNSPDEKGQLQDDKGATPEFPTNLKNEYKPTNVNPDARLALPEWLPMLEWSAFLKLRRKARKPADTYAQELLIRQLDKLRKSGDDPASVLRRSIANGWQSLVPTNSSARPLTDDEKLGLSRGGTTAADQNARHLRNMEAAGFLPRGTCAALKQELLAAHETFDCEKVRQIMAAMSKK